MAEADASRTTGPAEWVVSLRTAFVEEVGKPRGVSAAIDQDAGAVWRLRDGKLSAVEFHIDRAAALRAGGLDPADPGPPVAGI